VDENAHIEAMVRDVRRYARHFCGIALGSEPDPDLKRAFHDLRELKVDVAYPFLLELYEDYASKVLLKDDFVNAVRLIEAYVFRRAVCAIPTNSMNKTFSMHRGALPNDAFISPISKKMRSSTVSFKHGISTISGAAAIGCDASRTLGERSMCRLMNTLSSTLCRKMSS
jgi:uncharacterized protein with ParB-like and HNH nuclease domain